ncbi:MAG: hypothetical protein AAGA43_14595 [Bacteroidota bacterium]
MKKSLLTIVLCISIFVSFSACSEDSAQEEMTSETSENVVEETDPEDTSDDQNSGENNNRQITLTASADILTNDGEGEQQWDENLFISALKINGEPGRVVFEKRFRDDGFGVAGGRWEQIDYYYEYQGEVVKASEKLVLRFTIPVTNVILQAGQMDPNEGRQAKEGRTCQENNANKVDESGKWTAYNVSGEEIGNGILLDEYSIEGKLEDSMGSYRFELDAENIAKIVIEATQWGGEERGCPTNRASYANEPLNDSGNTENNSEFNIMAISYSKI